MKAEEVKKDLKSLKNYTLAINKLRETQETHIMRIKMLEKMQKSEKINSIIERERKLLSDLDIATKISEAQEIEEKYMKTILSLSPLDRSIILDAYINGQAYWKIGVAIGYSEEGVRKKISKIIKNIALSI
ncbi:MAG: hypothetical protein J6A96_05955 [Clostridia bacterium]|nr:hypothetical protein [Clostridia bacterium]